MSGRCAVCSRSWESPCRTLTHLPDAPPTDRPAQDLPFWSFARSEQERGTIMNRTINRLAASPAFFCVSPLIAGTPSPVEIDAHRSEIWSLAFSPDGAKLASASKDRTVKLWDAVTGKAIGSLEGHGSDVLRIAFSADGKMLASG